MISQLTGQREYSSMTWDDRSEAQAVPVQQQFWCWYDDWKHDRNYMCLFCTNLGL